MRFMKYNFHVFRKNLAAELERQHLTQRLIAEHSGIAEQLITRWKTGKAIPSIVNLCALASALNVSPGWLAFGEGQSPEDAEILAKLEKVPSDVRQNLLALIDACSHTIPASDVSSSQYAREAPTGSQPPYEPSQNKLREQADAQLDSVDAQYLDELDQSSEAAGNPAVPEKYERARRRKEA